MWTAFLFFPQLINTNAINEDGEEIDTESYCNSSLQCLVYFITHGIFDNGTNGLFDTISFYQSSGFFIIIFFYNFAAFILIGIIFQNIFTGLITDSFAENRQQTEKKKESLENECFICEKNREQCENDGKNFENHRKEVHNPLYYFYFLCYLFTKDREDFTTKEKSIWDSIEAHNFSWIPFTDN